MTIEKKMNSILKISVKIVTYAKKHILKNNLHPYSFTETSINLLKSFMPMFPILTQEITSPLLQYLYVCLNSTQKRSKVKVVAEINVQSDIINDFKTNQFSERTPKILTNIKYNKNYKFDGPF